MPIFGSFGAKIGLQNCEKLISAFSHTKWLFFASFCALRLGFVKPEAEKLGKCCPTIPEGSLKNSLFDSPPAWKNRPGRNPSPPTPLPPSGSSYRDPGPVNIVATVSDFCELKLYRTVFLG